MPEQANDFMTRAKAATYRSGETYETAWKVITVLIGGNNFCKVCNDQDSNSVAQFVTNMRTTFTILKTVPRLFVNVLPMVDISGLAQFVSGVGCEVALRSVCPCVMTAAGRAMITEFTKQYNAALLELIKEFPTTSDWAAVVQPFLTDTVIPDKSYITPADCFHPSALGQQGFAISLWNNMLSPTSRKATRFNPGDAPMCPNDDTLVYVF